MAPRPAAAIGDGDGLTVRSPTRRRSCCGAPHLLWLGVLIGWLVWLLSALFRICRLHSRDKECRRSDQAPWAVRKPDPMIYSQTFLQAHGLAVTWDNPDIHVELAANRGIPVDSHSLSPATDYVVVARVWNGATNAAAVGLPVKLSYLEFGIGTVRHDIAVVTVDLAVKGAGGCPAFARIPWTTPPTPGHYCLQVELIWEHDEEPGNNMGQHNTDVKPLNSPHAAFAFPVHNDQDRARPVRFQLDSYRVPALEPCAGDSRPSSPEQRERHRVTAARRHESALWPIPDGWRVSVEPEHAELASLATLSVSVDVTAPDGFRGRQVINVSAYEDAVLIGGVSLYVEGSG